MNRTTEDLIQSLAEDLPPVKPVAQLREILGMALLASLPLNLGWLLFLGLRPDLRAGAPLPSLFVPIVSMLVLMAVGGLLSGVAEAIPGRDGWMQAGRWIAILGGGAAASSIFFAEVNDIGHQAASAVHCVVGTAFLAVPAVTLCARFVVQGAPARRNRAFFLACFGGMGLAGVIIHMTCSQSGAMHLVLGHALAPAIGASVALAALLMVLAIAARRSATV